MLNNVDKSLLEKIADMPEGAADGAYNIRKDCGCASRAVTENINIETKTDKPGINITIKVGGKPHFIEERNKPLIYFVRAYGKHTDSHAFTVVKRTA